MKNIKRLRSTIIPEVVDYVRSELVLSKFYPCFRTFFSLF